MHAGNLTRRTTGEYVAEAYQTFFTQNYTASMVYVHGRIPMVGEEGNLDVRLQIAQPANLSGRLRLFIFLYRLAEDYKQGEPIFYSFIEKSIDLEGLSVWTERIWGPEILWGSDSEHERMRLEGYKIGLLLSLELSGSDHDDLIPFTADVAGLFFIGDFPVDSPLQNGVAVLLCGVFVAIHVQILGKSVVRVRWRDEKVIAYGLGALAAAICGFILLKVSFILDTVVMTIALYGASSFLVGRGLKYLLNALVVSLFFVVISNLSFFSFHYFIAICITFLSLLVLIKGQLTKNLESGWFGALCVEVVGLVFAFMIMVIFTVILFFLFGDVPRSFPLFVFSRGS